MLTVRLLGGASIEGEAGPLTGPPTQRHRLALLALLAGSHPRPVSRDKIVAHLWPESDPRPARNLLNQGVHALRRALGEEAILSAGDELRLDAPAVRVDVIELQEALAAGDPERAVGLHRGPFLDGFFLPNALEFERWAEGERERLRRSYLKALEELAEGASARGDREGAAGWWRRLAGEEPYNSHVILRSMEALEAAGDRAGAIRQAEAHAALLREELEAEPSLEVVALAERMRREPGGAAEAAVPAERVSSPSGEVGARREERAPASPRPPGRSRKRAWGLVGAAGLLAAAGWALVNGFSGGSAEIRRVAVLPLANHTGDPGQDYFVAGMHEALITELGQIADLMVISRQSVLRYEGSDRPLPAIARELGVEALVEGSVFRAGDSVRISAQLVRAAPEEHLWADTYRGALREALALQGEVARAIARAVHARVSPEARARLASAHAVKPEAQEAYLRGLYDIERVSLGTLEWPDEVREALRAAIAHLEEAVALEPEWAAAHAKLALAYHWKASAFPEVEAELVPRSKAAAMRALELDPNEAQAHASLGFVRFFFERDWPGAERAMRRALELDPNAHQSIYALYLRAVERYDEAIEHLRLAEERNPLSRRLKREIVVAYFCAGRYEEAVAQAEHVSSLWPERERAPLRGFLGNVYTAQSLHANAIAEYEEAVALSDSASWAVAGLAYVRARAGAHDQARGLLEWLEKERSASYHPMLHLALGDTESAAVMVEGALRERGLRAIWDQRCFPEWETLRTEPRVREILRRVGLPN